MLRLSVRRAIAREPGLAAAAREVHATRRGGLVKGHLAATRCHVSLTAATLVSDSRPGRRRTRQSHGVRARTPGQAGVRAVRRAKTSVLRAPPYRSRRRNE